MNLHITSRTVLIAIILSLSTLVCAQFAGGSGTADDPFLISTPDQLAYLSNYTGEARNTDEMTWPYAANTYAGWDFDEIWAEDQSYSVNDGYPYLQVSASDLYALNLFASPEEGGQVIGSGIYEAGEVIYIQAIQNEGWGFYNWTKDGAHFAWVQNFTFTMPAEDVELTANFKVTHTLTLEVVPEGAGEVSGAGAYIEGRPVPIATTANFGYTFINWTNDDGQVVSTQPAFTYYMPDNDVTLTANYIESGSIVIDEFPWMVDFEHIAFPPNGWTMANISGEVSWTRNSAPGGGHSAYHVYGNFLEDTWLISPAIIFPENSQFALNFRSYNYWASYYPGFGGNNVLISTGSPNPQDEDFELLWSPETVVEAWVETTLDLSAYAGDTLYIAFRYYAEYTHDWYVDDVEVAGIPEITTEPESLYLVIDPGTITEHEILIHNTGFGDLEYSAMVQIPAIKVPLPAPVLEQRTSNTGANISGGDNKPVGTTANNQKNVVLHYDGLNVNGVGLTNGGTFSVAARFPASLTAPYNGYAIQSVELYFYSMPTETKLKIWGQGTTLTPGDLLYEANFLVMETGWITVGLNESVMLESEDIWVGYEVTHNAGLWPAGIDGGPAAVDGDWLFVNNSWQRLSEISAFDANFNIRANLELEGFWLSLSPSAGMIEPGESEILTATIDATGLTAGFYSADIDIQSNDPLQPSTAIPVTLDVTTGLTVNTVQHVQIYPVPATDVLMISSTVKMDWVEIFNASGQKVERLILSGVYETRHNISHLPPGVYLVKIAVREGNTLHKKLLIQ